MNSKISGKNEIVAEFDIINIIQLICNAERENNLKIEIDEKQRNVNIIVHFDSDKEKETKIHKALKDIGNM